MNNDSAARRIQVFADPAALARAAAEEMTRRALAAVRTNGRATIALAGGSTPKALYGLLAAEPAFRQRFPWVQTHLFFGDERHVAPDHKESNFRMAREAMFDSLGEILPPANVHRVLSENPAAAAAAADYADVLSREFGEGTLPRFDVVLLGVGPEGHTASIFPGTTPLRETATVAAVYVEKFDTYRITFTPPVLRNSAAIVFLAAGKEKAPILARILEGSAEPDRFPAQGINAHTAGGETLWLLDRAAAAELKNPA